MTPIVKAVQGAKDSIVNIHGQKTLSAGEDPSIRGDMPRRVNGMGTGVVIDERGYIITNFHVVDGVQKIEVTTDDGTNYTAKFVSRDPVADLAVIKIDAPKKLPVITIGTSSDLMVGESVIAVGNAYGYENTVTRGIISALHRSVQVNDTQGYDDLIQVDAAINPGNSGGPLLNIDGEMIGINVAVRAGDSRDRLCYPGRQGDGRGRQAPQRRATRQALARHHRSRRGSRRTGSRRQRRG